MFSTFIYFSIKVDTFFETILFCSLSFRTLIPLVILPVCVLGMSFCGDLAFSSFVFLIFLSLFCCDELNVLFCSDEVASLRLLLKFSFSFSNLLFFWGVSELMRGLAGLLLFFGASVGDLQGLPGLFFVVSDLILGLPLNWGLSGCIGDLEHCLLPFFVMSVLPEKNYEMCEKLFDPEFPLNLHV